MKLIKSMFKIEDSDKMALAMIASEDGTSMSAIVRKLIRTETKRRRLCPPKVEKESADVRQPA